MRLYICIFYWITKINNLYCDTHICCGASNSSGLNHCFKQNNNNGPTKKIVLGSKKEKKSCALFFNPKIIVFSCQQEDIKPLYLLEDTLRLCVYYSDKPREKPQQTDYSVIITFEVNTTVRLFDV